MRKLQKTGLLIENVNANDYVVQAKIAERMGFDRFWIPEDTAYPGAFTACGAVAASTTKIEIGTCVVNPFTRHPVVTAMELASLDQISNGRAICGLGGGIKLWIDEQMGIAYRKPVTALRDAVEITRRLFAGEAPEYDGTMSRAGSGLRFNLTPLRANLPIILGVTGPQALELAGEIADGIMPVCTSAAGIRNAVERVNAGAARTGRSLADFDFGAVIVTAIAEDGVAARAGVRPVLATFLAWFANQPELSIFADYGLSAADVGEIRASWQRGEIRPDFVSEAMIDGLALAGTPAACRAQFDGLLDAGLTSAVFAVTGGPQFEPEVKALRRHLLG
jgi:5,10-methylenetetrahydromethanopterin reductase